MMYLYSSLITFYTTTELTENIKVNNYYKIYCKNVFIYYYYYVCETKTVEGKS